MSAVGASRGSKRLAVDYVIHGIVAAVSGVLVLFGSGVFIIQMQHPDDKNAAWLPKLIVLLGLFLTCAMVLMLPFDASMSQSCESDPECGVVGMIAQVWYAGFISVAVVAFVLIPLAYFWYETDDEDGIVTRAATTVCWSIVFCFVFVAILLALYFTMGVVDLPIIVMAPYATETTSWFVDPALARPLFKDVAAVPAFSATQSIRTSLVIYVLALLSFIGWCLMTVFAGIGMVALPMDLFIAFRDRPRPIDLKQFAERKLQLKKRCEELLAIGRQEKDAFKAKPNAFRERRFTLKYKKMVLDLEEEMTLLNICYKRNEINPLIPWIQLFGGFVSTVLTISWWIQLILEIFLDGIAGPYLSDVFTNLSAAFPLFGIVAYGVFAFYILICVVKGSIKFAGRFFLISMHPLKINGTMMNSLLFNVGLLLMCSISCTQLCTTAFAGFTHSSAISQLFVSQIQYLRGLSFFYSVQIPVFYSLLFCIGWIQFLWSLTILCCCPKKQHESIQEAMNDLRRDRG